jgi:hypothetical protein
LRWRGRCRVQNWGGAAPVRTFPFARLTAGDRCGLQNPGPAGSGSLADSVPNVLYRVCGKHLSEPPC